MKLGEFFTSKKGTWTMIAVFLVLLMATAVYPEFGAGEESAAPEPSVADADPGSQTSAEPDAQTPGGSNLEDGEALPDDPDTTLGPEAAAANAAPTSWLTPLAGGLGRGCGFSYDPTYGDYRYHHGIDLTAEPGTAVYAAASGTVMVAREDGMWGGIVTIEHGGGWKSVYRCLTPETVYGDTPEAGEIIGYIQETTAAEGGQEAHLHFELYLNDEEVDPAEWIAL